MGHVDEVSPPGVEETKRPEAEGHQGGGGGGGVVLRPFRLSNVLGVFLLAMAIVVGGSKLW